MGHSTKVKWQVINGKTSFFAFVFNDETGKISNPIIFLPIKKVQSLKSIIHEINECETTFLICEILKENFFKMEEINVTKQLIKKYPWVFNKIQKTCVTHIISPYGLNNCVFARHRRKNHKI